MKQTDEAPWGKRTAFNNLYVPYTTHIIIYFVISQLNGILHHLKWHPNAVL